MLELIAHLFGDYVLQNHVMATRKTSSSKWAAIHVGLYSLPFLFVTWSPLALAVIAGTHFVIDRFKLAGYWVRFWGIGCPSLFMELGRFARMFGGVLPCNEPDDYAPPFLAVWLAIIVDNTFHLTINHLALKWF